MDDFNELTTFQQFTVILLAVPLIFLLFIFRPEL